jgi:hypothetical protein
MQPAVQIYGLIDPRTSQLRYIGKTSRPLIERRWEHEKRARKSTKHHVWAWVRQLLNDGTRPEIICIEAVTGEGWVEAEQFWIAYFRSLGCYLANSSIGGDGSCHINFGEQHKRLIGEANRRNWAAQAEKIIPQLRARAADPDLRAANSELMRARWRGDWAHRRGEKRNRPIRFDTNCIECGEPFGAKNRTAVLCSGKCRQRRLRRQKRSSM